MNPIFRIRKQISPACHIISTGIDSLRVSNRLRLFTLFQPIIFSIIIILFTACDSSANTPSINNAKQTLSTSSGSTVTYNTRPQDVLIRTFYGGGKLGTFEMSPEISIYGDETFILGPGLQIKQGRLQAVARQHLVHNLLDRNGFL